VKINREHIAIVLVQPQIPENIGAAARAMNNMGIRRLVVVDPKECDLSRVLKMATGSSIDLIEEMELCEDLTRAVASYEYVVGTTARTGSLRPAMTHPRRLAHNLVPISQDNHVAVLFGPEHRGLTNEELRLCHSIVTIPTADFSSLNLAHAVMILCYEIFLASRDSRTEYVPRLATREELEGMYEHVKQMCLKIGFIDPQNPEHWMLNIRRFLSRLPLRAREVRIIRGVCRQIDWYTEQLEKLRKGAGGP
jgi:tRNA/rRNA methyltransferase